MTDGFQAPVCATCRHPVGDHKSSRASFPHPPRYGVCLVADCDCREFVEAGEETARAA